MEAPVRAMVRASEGRAGMTIPMASSRPPLQPGEDRSGVVRWTWIESPSPEDISQYGRFPTDDEIVAAVRVAGV
jgi:hypothetical protein